MAIIYCMHSCAEIITFENEVISKLKCCQRSLQKYYLDNSVPVLGGRTSHRPGANVFCRQLSLTNPLATEDGRNYQSCPFRFRWRTQTLISLTQTAAIISRMRRHFGGQCQRVLFREVRYLGDSACTRKSIDHQHGERGISRRV